MYDNRELFCRLAIACLICLLLPLVSAAHEPEDAHIAEVTRKIRQNPTDANLYIARGDLYKQIDRFALAIADYNRAARLDPSLTDHRNWAVGEVHYAAGQAHVTKGEIYSEQRRGRLASREGALARREMQLAIEFLNRFLEKQPQHSRARVTRARAAMYLEMYSQAAEDFSVAINSQTNAPPEYYLERAQALLAAGPQNGEKALEGLDEGIKRVGPTVTLQKLAIDIEESMGRHDNALRRLDSIIKQSDRKEVWLVEKGRILLKAERPEEANTAFKSALREIESLPSGIRATPATRSMETLLRNRIRQ